MYKSLFTDVLKGKEGSRPPVWYMRQAGRVLPDYRKLRERHSFQEMMEQPELATDVTLMPVAVLGFGRGGFFIANAVDF